MQLVTTALAGRGVLFRYDTVRITDLPSFRSAFVTNSLGVAPLGQVDDQAFPQIPRSCASSPTRTNPFPGTRSDRCEGPRNSITTSHGSGPPQCFSSRRRRSPEQLREPLHHPDPADRRARRIVATTRGRVLLIELGERLRAAEDHVLAGLDN